MYFPFPDFPFNEVKKKTVDSSIWKALDFFSSHKHTNSKTVYCCSEDSKEFVGKVCFAHHYFKLL